jgi:hypothetical protein
MVQLTSTPAGRSSSGLRVEESSFSFVVTACSNDWPAISSDLKISNYSQASDPASDRLLIAAINSFVNSPRDDSISLNCLSRKWGARVYDQLGGE